MVPEIYIFCINKILKYCFGPTLYTFSEFRYLWGYHVIFVKWSHVIDANPGHITEGMYKVIFLMCFFVKADTQNSLTHSKHILFSIF